MQAVVCDFRARAAGAGATQRSRLAGQARRAIGRLHKQFKHKIDDMLRRDAKRRWGINDRERLGLEDQLQVATEGAIERLEQAVQDLSSADSAEPDAAVGRPCD
jgi:hypothetical protein